MTEAFLYRNPAEPLSDFMGGGFAVYDQNETTVTQGDIAELRDKAVSSLTGNLDLILPFPSFIPGQTTAVATLIVPKLGGRDIDTVPIGYGRLVTHAGPSRIVRLGAKHEITDLYVIPETSDGLNLRRKGIGTAILHKLLEDVQSHEPVVVKHIPNLGPDQTNTIIDKLIKLKFIKNRKSVQKLPESIDLTVEGFSRWAGVLSLKLEEENNWLGDRISMGVAIEELKGSFENLDLPPGVSDLAAYRKLREEAKAKS